MKTILFSLPGNEELVELLATKMDAEVGKATLRKFPDGESYTRILSARCTNQTKNYCHSIF